MFRLFALPAILMMGCTTSEPEVADAFEPLAEVRITEVMVDPEPCPDSDGEWVELANPTDETLVLDGFFIGDRDGNRAEIASLTIEPRGYAVVALTVENAWCSGGPVADAFVHGWIDLDNTGEQVTIEDPRGNVLDRTAAFAGADILPDTSLQLTGDTWLSAAQCGPATPGAENPPCEVAPPQIDPEWFDLPCQSDTCVVPSDYDPTPMLDAIWDTSEAAFFASDYDTGGLLFFAEVTLSNSPVRADAWFESAPQYDVLFYAPAPESADVWVSVDLNGRDLDVHTVQSNKDQQFLSSTSTLTGIGFPGAIAELAVDMPDFIVTGGILEHPVDSPFPVLTISSETTSARWNATTGERL